MKNKAIRFFLITAGIGLALTVGLYFFVDLGFHGALGAWLESQFMTRYTGWQDPSGSTIYVSEPNWSMIRRVVLPTLVGLFVLTMVIFAVVNHYWTKTRLRNATAEICELIEEFMESGKSASLIFPKEYGDIAVKMSDIRSNMERHERLLREEEARKNDLITYLAHDLKTPLTSVIGYLSLLSEAPDLPTEQRIKYVGITLEKAERLEHLINEFFDITRYNLQQMPLQIEQTDLSYMLMQLCDEFYPLLSAHDNTVRLDCPDNLTLSCDANKLARVFNNILKNAVTYSTPGTPITVQATDKDNHIDITISNLGPTIPPEKLAQIFDKFFRIDESRSTQTGGAGLGLAIAREIVNAHHGTLTAESNDGCTTFRVHLPH